MTDNGAYVEGMRAHLDELVAACRALHREMRPWIKATRGRADPLEAVYYLGGALLMHCTSALALIDRGLWGDARAIARSMFETQWVLMYFSLGSVPGVLAQAGLSEEEYRADVAGWLDGKKVDAAQLRRLATLQDTSGTQGYLNEIYADYSGYVHSSRRSATADMSRDTLRFWYDGKPDHPSYKTKLLPDVVHGLVDAVPSFLLAIQQCLERNGASMDAHALKAACAAYVGLIDLLTVGRSLGERRHIVDAYTAILRRYGFPVP